MTDLLFVSKQRFREPGGSLSGCARRKGAAWPRAAFFHATLVLVKNLPKNSAL
jgi:hypothetical protein